MIRERAHFMPDVREPRVCVSVASETPPYARGTIMGRAEIVGRPGQSDAWRPIAERMALAYIGERGPAYIEGTAHFPRWLVRVVPETMTTWRGGVGPATTPRMAEPDVLYKPRPILRNR